MSDDLPEFLLARVEEDEATIREALSARPADVHWKAPFLRAGSAETRVLARFNPTRALAECEAKRELIASVERHAKACGPNEEYVRQNSWHLRNMATIYADHPDYREEWKP